MCVEGVYAYVCSSICVYVVCVVCFYMCSVVCMCRCMICVHECFVHVHVCMCAHMYVYCITNVQRDLDNCTQRREDTFLMDLL